MCLHTIILDPSNPQRMFIAISAAGAFRTDDGGNSWTPINRGLKSQYIPDPNAEIGHCVHRIAMHRSRPNVLFMQKHWDVMRSDNGGESWQEVSGNLPTDFGFPIDVHAHEPQLTRRHHQVAGLLEGLGAVDALLNFRVEVLNAHAHAVEAELGQRRELLDRGHRRVHLDGSLDAALEREVKRLHSYDVPEFVALPIVAGSKEYLAWLGASVRA